MDFLDGETDLATRAQFEAHVRDCPNCEAFLNQYTNTIQLARSGGTIAIPDELVRRTIDFLQEHYDDE